METVYLGKAPELPAPAPAKSSGPPNAKLYKKRRMASLKKLSDEKDARTVLFSLTVHKLGQGTTAERTRGLRPLQLCAASGCCQWLLPAAAASGCC